MPETNEKAAAPRFSVKVAPMQASNGVTYLVCLDRADRPADAMPWAPGRLTPINRNSLAEANDEGQAWADFLGVDFEPCQGPMDSGPNTIPEYGSRVARGQLVAINAGITDRHGSREVAYRWVGAHRPAVPDFTEIRRHLGYKAEVLVEFKGGSELPRFECLDSGTFMFDSVELTLSRGILMSVRYVVPAPKAG